jgi:ATP-dependent RNA helicase DeaD
MLDMGFREDLEFILETTPPQRRTLLFSATLPKAIVTMATHYQKDALRIAARGETSGHADIEYRAIRIAGNKIERAVVNLLRYLDPPGALVFRNTRERVRHMEAQLTERGFHCVALSGELSQSERNHALQALRDGRARVCVATDVAARGIDLPGLALVIHADLPNDAAVLQHRSGRTGRAGKKGVSVLLVPPSRRRRAEEMLGRARVTATWGEVPGAAQIRKLDQERLLQNPLLTEAAGDDDLAMADTLLETQDVRQLAAAFVKLYRAGLPAPEDIEEEAPFQRDRHEKGPKDHKARDHAPRDHKPAHNKGPRPPRDHAPRDRGPRAPRENDMQNGIWFRLNVGRERNADPKWLLPEICRQGDVTKQDIGAIRVFDTETLFQVDGRIAEEFAAKVTARKKGGVRILPARDQTGESHGRPYGETKAAEGGDAPPPKPGGFAKKSFGHKPGGHKPGDKKKFAEKKKFGGKNKKFHKHKPDRPRGDAS